MTGDGLNRASGAAMVGFALVALVTVLVGAVQVLTGRITMPEPDEGAGAHIFQLAVLFVLPLGALFVASADWTRPRRSLRLVAATGVFLAVAFVTLYYFEHVRAY